MGLGAVLGAGIGLSVTGSEAAAWGFGFSGATLGFLVARVLHVAQILLIALLGLGIGLAWFVVRIYMAAPDSFKDFLIGPDKYSVVCLQNSTNYDIPYSHQWENESSWTKAVLHSGDQEWHGNRVPQKFYIQFDESYESGMQQRDYYLDSYGAGTDCNFAKKYVFSYSGGKVKLWPLN
jgi:hypothetical protein